MNLVELTKEILNADLSDEEISSLWDTLRTKSRLARDQRIALNVMTLKIGSTVMISRISPKKYEGTIGKIVGHSKRGRNRFDVEVISSDHWDVQAGSKIPGLPASTLTAYTV